MKIFLDDVRDLPADEFYKDFIVVRTVSQLVALMAAPDALSKLTHISFDHDLGLSITGYDIAKRIETCVAESQPCGLVWYGIHSANPVGAANIDAAMKNVMRMLGR